MKLRRIVEEDEVLKNTSEIKDIKEKKITPTEDAATASAIDSIKVNKENAEKNIAASGIKKVADDVKKELDGKEKRGPKTPKLKPYTESKKAKDRKELAAFITEAKAKNHNYKISKCLEEGYRYLFEEDATDNAADNDDLNWKKYKGTIEYTVSVDFDVEAESKEAAEEFAINNINAVEYADESIGFESNNNSDGGDITITSVYVDGYLEHCNIYEEIIEGLDSKKGTIANVLKNHMSEINAAAAGGPNKMRDKIVDILKTDSDLIHNKAVEEAITILNSINGPKLYSTIATYMTGQRVINPAKEKQKRNSDLEDTEESLKESDDCVVVDHYVLDDGTEIVTTLCDGKYCWHCVDDSCESDDCFDSENEAYEDACEQLCGDIEEDENENGLDESLDEDDKQYKDEEENDNDEQNDEKEEASEDTEDDKIEDEAPVYDVNEESKDDFETDDDTEDDNSELYGDEFINNDIGGQEAKSEDSDDSNLIPVNSLDKYKPTAEEKPVFETIQSAGAATMDAFKSTMEDLEGLNIKATRLHDLLTKDATWLEDMLGISGTEAPERDIPPEAIEPDDIEVDDVPEVTQEVKATEVKQEAPKATEEPKKEEVKEAKATTTTKQPLVEKDADGNYNLSGMNDVDPIDVEDDSEEKEKAKLESMVNQKGGLNNIKVGA